MDFQRSAAHIGILDSGLGGLSVLREIRQQLPLAKLSYVADSAYCPYGSKAEQFIRERVSDISDFLLAQGVELLVIACNSATIVAVETLRASYPVPIVGMEPAIKPAAEKTSSGVIGVLATEASLAGEKYHRLVSTHAQDLQLITRAAPEFVTLVEAGKLAGSEVEAAIALHLEPLLDAGADVLVLGCTHYPFLRPAMEAYLQTHYPERPICLLDTGAAVAAQTLRCLQRNSSTLPYPSPNSALAKSAQEEAARESANQKPQAQFHAFTSCQASAKLAKLITQLAQEPLSQLETLPLLSRDPLHPSLDPSA